MSIFDDTLQASLRPCCRAALRCRRPTLYSRSWGRSTTGRCAKLASFDSLEIAIHKQSMAQARLYNGSAVCSMRMGEWDDAEKELQEAYQKDAKNPDTLSNLIAAGLHLGKNVSRYIKYVSCHASLQLQGNWDV